METTLIRAIETISVLAAVLTLGAGLGGIIGYVAMYRRDRKHKPAIHDRMRDDTDRGIRGSYTPEANKLPPPPSVNLPNVILRAVQSDRSDRSRKGWQTRRRERERQQDADILTMIGTAETQTGKGRV
jgi:hypothetical protein